jgi:arylsulfatase A-like enzyme
MAPDASGCWGDIMTGVLRSAGGAPNILLITSDEERYTLPQPGGFVLPARERLQERGVAFDCYYVASAQCSSSRSVIYTGRQERPQLGRFL